MDRKMTYTASYKERQWSKVELRPKLESQLRPMNRLKVNVQQSILRLAAHGWSRRRIVRELKLDRATVSFAVGTLLRWYRSGINPQQRLWDLSNFMGHVHPASWLSRSVSRLWRKPSTCAQVKSVR